MYRSKAKQRRIFTNRRRPRRSFSLLGAIFSLALLLLALELLTRIVVDLSGNRDRFTQAEGEAGDITQAYQLNFASSDRSANLKQALLAVPSLSVGYELVGDRQSKYWQLNQQGFRDRDPLPLAKPKDEIRVFLLGNSTAFGYGNIDNAATISAQLESRLQQRLQQQQASPQLYKPNVLPADKAKRAESLAKPSKIKSGNYRVINAAVPGYASGNELAQLALKILKYKPDLIVVMDGYVDLMLPSVEKVTPAPPTETDPQTEPNTVGAYIDRLLEPIQKNSYLVKAVQNYRQNSAKTDKPAEFLFEEQTSNLVRYLPTDESELQKRVDRYVENQKQILSLSAAAQAPLIVALQPEITGRDASLLTPTEGEIATELGRTYIRRMREDYPVAIAASQALAKAYPKNLKVIDMYRMSDKYPSPSFIDPIHLNEEANKKVAEQLYYAISSLQKMQVSPQQPAKLAPNLRDRG